MVEEGIDLTVRVGHLPDSNLIAKKLCDTPVVVFASPEYLARNGRPKTPMDLSDHQWITFSVLSSPIVGSFYQKSTGKQVEHKVSSNLKINSADAVIDAAIQGLGISALVETTVHEHLASGRLIPVLEDYELAPRGVYALYPHREHLPPKVRIFIDFLEKHCASCTVPRKY